METMESSVKPRVKIKPKLGLKGIFNIARETFDETMAKLNPPTRENVQSFTYKPLPLDFSVDIQLDKVSIFGPDPEKSLIDVNTPKESIKAMRLVKMGSSITVEFITN
jgi:hypothetical protein